jgi:hypothetical protein
MSPLQADDVGRPITYSTHTADRVGREVEAALAEAPGLSKRKLAAKLGRRQQEVRRAVDRVRRSRE